VRHALLVPPDQLAVRGVPNTLRDRVISWSLWAVLPGVLLLSAHLPDALDRLPARERAIAGFLDDAGICGLPFGRVVEVQIDDLDDPRSIHYRCGWTVLRLGSSTQEAYCAEGRWQVAGLREMHSTGSC
jgi:hypothetical protein